MIPNLIIEKKSKRNISKTERKQQFLKKNHTKNHAEIIIINNFTNTCIENYRFLIIRKISQSFQKEDSIKEMSIN